MFNIIADILGRPSGGGIPAPAPIGTINTETAWANLTNFTVVGNATPVISTSGGLLNMTGGSGGTLFTNYIQMTKAGNSFVNTCLENWTQRVTVTTPSSFGASSFGFACGVRSINTINVQSIAIQWDWTNAGGGFTVWFLEGISVSTAFGSALVPVANTTYVCEYIRAKNVITVNIYQSDGTTLLRTATTTIALTVPSNSKNMHNTGKFTLQNFGGTFNISNWTISSTANKNAAYAAVGDSIMYGLGSGSNAVRYAEQALTAAGKTFNIMGGPGDHTAEVVARLPEIVAMAPQNVYLNVGRNDVADGIATGTWQANYNTIISTLQGAGITVKHGTPVATSVDLTALVTFVNGKGLTTADEFTTTKNGLGNLNATYDAGDAIHPNATGCNAMSPVLQAIL